MRGILKCLLAAGAVLVLILIWPIGLSRAVGAAADNFGFPLSTVPAVRLRGWGLEVRDLGFRDMPGLYIEKALLRFNAPHRLHTDPVRSLDLYGVSFTLDSEAEAAGDVAPAWPSFPVTFTHCRLGLPGWPVQVMLSGKLLSQSSSKGHLALTLPAPGREASLAVLEGTLDLDQGEFLGHLRFPEFPAVLQPWDAKLALQGHWSGTNAELRFQASLPLTGEGGLLTVDGALKRVDDQFRFAPESHIAVRGSSQFSAWLRQNGRITHPRAQSLWRLPLCGSVGEGHIDIPLIGADDGEIRIGETRLSGVLAGRIHWDWKRSLLPWFALTIKNLKATADEIQIQDIQGTVDFESLFPTIQTKPFQTVTAGALTRGSMELTSGTLRFQWWEGVLYVEKMEWEWLDGQIIIPAFQYPAEQGQPLDLDLFFNHIPLQPLLENYNSKSLQATGYLYGRFPVEWQPGRVPVFKRGFLFSEPGGGLLQLGEGSLGLQNAVPKGHPQKNSLILADEAFRDFDYQYVQILISGPSDASQVTLDIKGQGRNAPYSPVELTLKTEGLVDQGLALVLDLSKWIDLIGQSLSKTSKPTR